jgi:hypothetical protein
VLDDLGAGLRPDPSELSYPCTTILEVVVRKKRSISMPPDLDSSIERAAAAEGTSYSGWLAAVVRKELTIGAGLDAVGGFERSHGRFTPDELAEAETWANEALARSRRSGARRRRSA